MRKDRALRQKITYYWLFDVSINYYYYLQYNISKNGVYVKIMQDIVDKATTSVNDGCRETKMYSTKVEKI